MKKLQKLNEQFDIKEIESVIKDNPGTIDDGMNEMDKMFENTSIGKIAKEITEELDIENIVTNGGGIQDLFSGGNMANIMQTISSKISDNQEAMAGDNLMEEAYLDLDNRTVGIYIPADEVLQRTKYQWFAVLPSEQLLQSKMIISKYILASMVDSTNEYYKSTKIHSVVTI